MKIGLYGDSTQVGVSYYGGQVYQADWPPSRILQLTLDNKYGQGVHTVSNYGIGGSTLHGAVHSSLFPEGTVLQHMAARDDDIVVANWGINDVFIPGLAPDTHKANYLALKNAALASGKKFVYEAPNPLNHTHNVLLSALHAAVVTIPGLTVMDNYTQITRYYPLWKSHLSDGIHPNYIMYFWIGDHLFKTIDNIIREELQS